MSYNHTYGPQVNKSVLSPFDLIRSYI